MIHYWDIETTSLECWEPEARITVIGIMADEGGLITFFDDADEGVLLTQFWAWIRQHSQERLVGYNSCQYDFKYCVKRSIACNVRPYMPFRFKNFDLRNAIDENHYAKGTLNQVCTAINGEHKWEDLSGKDVIQLYYDGRIDELKRYLTQDLAMTRIVFLRLWHLGLIPADIKQPEVI